jgi:flavin-dependent dehydrogenase
MGYLTCPDGGRWDTGHVPQAVSNSPDYDVIVIGGALSGAATALLLCREHPGLRVCILERSESHKRRVGEATVEVGTWFLGRWLGMMGHLNDAHISKQGLRFWHFKGPGDDLEACSEIGGRYLARVASFLVDRAVLDEEVLRRATAGGAKMHRGVVVHSVKLVNGGRQVVGYREASGIEVEVTCRWVVDASGPAAFLARREGWWRSNEEHPTAAAWARWRGVGNWDDPALIARHPKLSGGFFGMRNTATTHLMGDGWWAWMITLKGGDVSVGVVFDQRRMEWPTDGSMAQRLKTFYAGIRRDMR